MPEVRVIQPTILPTRKQRVCAYARVSSDSEDQLNSFAVQVEYYTQYIQEKGNWEFAGIYADEGITGTIIDKREEFKRLLQDCRAGKIDRVLVKSVSRFSRNLTDYIKTVRELKRLGVSIEFEREHIDTGTMGSEMLLSILGSAAQEESMSISKNLKWSYQKRMRSGEFITCSAPLGYFLRDHTLVPNPEEVPIVEYIFQSYLAGKSTKEVAEDLSTRNIPTIRQQSSKWHHTVIQKVLSNEKYAGNSIVQKFFTTFLKPDVVRINQEISELMKQNHSLSRLQTKGCIDSALFIERSSQNNQRRAQLYGELRKFCEPDTVSQQMEDTKLLLDLLERESPMVEFEAEIFKSMVTEIRVETETLCFQLANGLTLEERR